MSLKALLNAVAQILWYALAMKKNPLRLAVFDLDGTLVELDTEHFIDYSIEIIHEMGFTPHSREQLRELMRQHRLEFLFPEEQREKATAEYWRRFDPRRMPDPRVFDGALATLEAMVARGCDLAIATARSQSVDELREFLRPTGILTHVEFLSTWWNTSWVEKVEQLTHVCREHNVEPAAALMAGDSTGDIRSARQVGFGLTIGLLTGAHSEEVLRAENPTYLANSIVEVPPIVERHF